jgi:UDP-glucose 4-epimerase
VPYEQAYEEGFEDMMRRVPDIGKINRLVGYEPKISLDETLKSVIDYQKLKLQERDSSPLAFHP